MPIYAYRCQNCGFAKDVLQKVSDAPLVDCPSCNQPSFKKQLTAAGFQLKGTGWYVTDFRNGGNGSGNGAAKTTSTTSADSSSESSSATASESSSPATTTESSANKSDTN